MYVFDVAGTNMQEDREREKTDDECNEGVCV